jgi:CRP-like cAMP-binding protein
MESVVPVLQQTEFFADLPTKHLEALAACATSASYPPGNLLCRIGEDASAFWLVLSGRVAVGLFVPGRGEITLSVLSEGEVAGFSWMVPSSQVRLDIVALTPVTALRFDGRVLREKCKADPVFGYEIVSRFTGIVLDRIDAMSMQLLDVYGEHPVEQE